MGSRCAQHSERLAIHSPGRQELAFCLTRSMLIVQHTYTKQTYKEITIRNLQGEGSDLAAWCSGVGLVRCSLAVPAVPRARRARVL